MHLSTWSCCGDGGLDFGIDDHYTYATVRHAEPCCKVKALRCKCDYKSKCQSRALSPITSFSQIFQDVLFTLTTRLVKRRGVCTGAKLGNGSTSRCPSIISGYFGRAWLVTGIRAFNAAVDKLIFNVFSELSFQDMKNESARILVSSQHD